MFFLIQSYSKNTKGTLIRVEMILFLKNGKNKTEMNKHSSYLGNKGAAIEENAFCCTTPVMTNLVSMKEEMCDSLFHGHLFSCLISL